MIVKYPIKVTYILRFDVNKMKVNKFRPKYQRTDVTKTMLQDSNKNINKETYITDYNRQTKIPKK